MVVGVKMSTTFKLYPEVEVCLMTKHSLCKHLESPLDCEEMKTSQSSRKSILNIHWKDWCWSWNSNMLATWCKELPHWKRLWCWGRLKAGGEGDDWGWDGWMASLTRWTWVWASSRRWWKQGSLVCCSPWGHNESDTTEWLNNNKYVNISFKASNGSSPRK